MKNKQVKIRSLFSLILIFVVFNFTACSSERKPQLDKLPSKKTLTKEVLQDKVKGGWAGQTIGVTYGAPYEFKFNGTFIQDYQPIVWHDDYLKDVMINEPGIYDDVYVDLTFVEVIERLGIDAPVDSFAMTFAKTKYHLWHANQVARYNILNGMKAPESGYWKNNPHADDLDFQIESDFTGLMSPGMPNAAAEIGDKVGHIMNYGDGWYGGIYVGAMYALAFVVDDVNFIVEKALEMIPEKSEFHQAIADVIQWHKQYPKDWHQTWFEIQKKWSSDIGCPKGVFDPFNIDAKLNAAYVVLGLLYGEGDYGKSLEISTRAGSDADCNPAIVGGVLGTMVGYSNIPDYWKGGLTDVEDLKFMYSTMSLNDVYEVGFRHALQMVERNGGSIDGDNVNILVQKPETVRFEKSFEGIEPVEKVTLNKRFNDTISFKFNGVAFAITGKAEKKNNKIKHGRIKADLFLDGEKVETAIFPTNFITRRFDLFWKYDLEDKEHDVKIVIKNPERDYNLLLWDYVVYANE